MGRYLILSGYDYYPAGSDDFVTVMDDLGQARIFSQLRMSDSGKDWLEVFDLVEFKVVYGLSTYTDCSVKPYVRVVEEVDLDD